MKLKNIKQAFFYLVAIGSSILLLSFFVGIVWIDYIIKDSCERAKAKYGGACTEALVLLLDDDTRSYKDRNNAIWVLGQLGDAHALNTLEKYYTGNVPAKESLNETISQYELEKAIKAVKGDSINIPTYFRKKLKFLKGGM